MTNEVIVGLIFNSALELLVTLGLVEIETAADFFGMHARHDFGIGAGQQGTGVGRSSYEFLDRVFLGQKRLMRKARVFLALAGIGDVEAG